ncbi:MAG: hemolysin III family protein, partial [Clostridia bacterium]|nr:hemolysin III family protein [Clostridia bacterium]
MVKYERIPFKDRQMPDYTGGEEIFNMVTHIVGGGLGIIALVLCVTLACLNRNAFGIASSIIYGISLIILYTMS